MKLKWSILLNPLGNIIQENYGSFYPSGLFTLDHFTMRHPVTPNNLNPHSLVCTKSSFLKKEGVKMHCSKKKNSFFVYKYYYSAVFILKYYLTSRLPAATQPVHILVKIFLMEYLFSSLKTFDKLFISSES